MHRWLSRVARKSATNAAVSCVLALCGLAGNARAQQPNPRITSEIDNSVRVTLQGTQSPRVHAEDDIGRVATGTKVQGISMEFCRTASQEADLQTLLAAQQDPTSPLYHKWLTPDEFGARFGLADSDLAEIRLWLEQQGFSVEGISRSKNRITFSGTVGQIEAAFGTELHYYKLNGTTYYAPATDLTIPSGLAPVVQNVRNLTSFRPRPRVKFRAPQRATKADFTSSQSGDHFLTPKDVATIYDITAAYNAGYTGADESIAVVGQSSIVLSDIENFQSAAGFAKKDPTLVLVPDSGSATVVSGDEAESDIDLEYSSTIGKGATIYFVYTGNNPNYSVWDSIQYAIQEKIAPIISDSYGACETAIGASDYATLNAILAQGAAQGQTFLAPAGDNGSTDCYGETGLTTAQQEALAVDFPASSQYVTAMGGSEFPSADVAASNTTYWEAANGSDVVSSALSYIPEQAWNDDSSNNGISSGGGGISTFTGRPSWQTGVTGIPSGSYRLVPDLSLSASPNNAGYLYCSSDTDSTGITGSCSNGFRDSNDTYLTVAGGTSFCGPIFAGMLSVLSQKLNSSGFGVVNSALYTLAADSTTYGSAFHDITSGGNECTAGSNYCSSAGESEYPATTGYDEATGLGSIDFYNLLSAWPTSSSSLTATTTTLAAATTTPGSGVSDNITITVASASSSVTTTPTGTLAITVDGSTVESALALSSGAATYTFSSSTSGTHTVTAVYSGDSTFASSTGTLTLTVGGSSQGFTLAASNVTVSAGSAGTSTITITPKNGYTGTIAWSVSTSSTLSNACYTLADTTVSGTSAVTTTMTIYTSSASCASTSSVGAGKRRFLSGVPIASREKDRGPKKTMAACVSFSMAGLLFVGLLGFSSRKPGLLASVFLVAVVGFALWGCSGAKTSSSSSSSTDAPTGTYTLTIVGTDTSSSSITSSTTMTLTIN